MRQGLGERDDVPELRAGEAELAFQGVLLLRFHQEHQRQGARVPVLHHAADPQRHRPVQEHGHPRGQAASAPHCLPPPECQRQQPFNSLLLLLHFEMKL
ncbi:unnamed protein product [Linum tenue]|uniref:Uncharacterized protein n=1 Tax=Linum tenue TaxID=586396 RepID=A0AAV0H802_9ROSI|nr:unnamed protein product [Linum tenue]